MPKYCAIVEYTAARDHAKRKEEKVGRYRFLVLPKAVLYQYSFSYLSYHKKLVQQLDLEKRKKISVRILFLYI